MKESIRSCVQEICESIADGSLDPGPTSQVKDWVRGADGNFRPRYRARPSVTLPGLEVRASFRACIDQARNDEIAGPQLGELVGTSVGRVRLTLDQIVRTLVSSMFIEEARFAFDDECFEEEWVFISHFLRVETFDFITVAPLLPSFSAPVPVQISDNIVIDWLTDEEVNRCALVGILEPLAPGIELINVNRAIGIRCSTTIDKIVGDTDIVPQTGSFGRRGLLDATTVVDDVLAGLRLFKGGSVQCPGEVSYVKAWLLDAGHHFRLRASPQYNSSDYELSDQEVRDLQVLWSDLTEGTLDERPFLSTALRRFKIAFDRQQLDDRIVDLMIAAESLFLDDVRSPGGRGELRYRLAIRAGRFVECPRYTPRQVFDLMRKAYDVRSRVVHGGSVIATPLPDDPDASLNEFLSMFEEIIRLGLKKAVFKPGVGRNGYWDDLVLSNPDGIQSG